MSVLILDTFQSPAPHVPQSRKYHNRIYFCQFMIISDDIWPGRSLARTSSFLLV